MKSWRSLLEQRQYNMSRIRSGDTKIEISLRRALWHEGIRYRKNDKTLPGKPDIAITRYRIAIFCDGEFWHGRDWHIKKQKIQVNREYWIAKIERNMNHDDQTDRQLQNMGWTVLRFWGDDIHNDLDACVAEVKDAILQIRIDSCDATEDGFYALD